MQTQCREAQTCKPTSASLLSVLRCIKLLVLDVDGTLTDGSIILDEKGNHAKVFSVKDGIAIRSLPDHGLAVGIISHSSRQHGIEARAKALRIKHCYVGKDPKAVVLASWCEQLGIQPAQIAVIGDDINDLDMFDFCAHAACPSDASARIRAVADLVLGYPGGKGCVREWISDYYLNAKKWTDC